MRWTWPALAVALFLVALVAFAAGIVAQVEDCDSVACAGKSGALRKWWALAGVCLIGGLAARYRWRSGTHES